MNQSKLIGGGFPMSAVAGRTDIMSHFDDRDRVDREGFLIQVGTLNGNPIASVAGLKTLKILRRTGQFEKLNNIDTCVQEAIRDPLDALDIPH